MSNVYRAPENEPAPKEEAPRIEFVPGDAREEGITLEKAAANANLLLVSGINRIHNPHDEKNPFKQPFWFVHDYGELTGVYCEAEAVRSRDDRGKLQIAFKIAEAKERLKELLIGYYATGGAQGLSIIQFGGARGFRLKTANPMKSYRR